MKIVFHEKFFDVYSSDPASAERRLEPAYETLKNSYDLVIPQLAQEEDILLVHGQIHVDRVRRDPHLYEISSLAVGGAIRAAETAFDGEPAFGLIRPPGHHASPDSCWGFCYFNNVAIALRRLMSRNKITKALIVDFDLHFGDGTSNTFREDQAVVYHHMGADPGELDRFLSNAGMFDIVGVSAGFDRGLTDWGGMLSDEDFRRIGGYLKRFSEGNTRERRFAVLEGGYNQDTLGPSILSFLRGFG